MASILIIDKNREVNLAGLGTSTEMEEKKLILRERDLTGSLLPFLRGRVFHVSLLINLEQIKESGEIRPNKSGVYETPFRDKKSFFRDKGCVCLFDYDSPTENELKESLCRCSPIHWIKRRPEAGLAIFMLRRQHGLDLLCWKLWKEREAPSDVVPYVETGHKGPIALKEFDEVLCVRVELDDNPLVTALRAQERREPLT